MKNLIIFLMILSISQTLMAQTKDIFAPHEVVLKLSESVSQGEMKPQIATEQLKELEDDYKLNSTDKSIIHQYIDPSYQFKTSFNVSEKSQIERDLTLSSQENYKREFTFSRNEKIFLGILVFALGSHLYLESQNKEVVFTF